MTLEAVDAKYYQSIIPAPYHVFAGAKFNELNADKVEEVYYLLFKDSKYRLGIIGGKRGDTFASPFSAPFGGFAALSEDVRLTAIEAAVERLTDWCGAKGLAKIKLTLPPPIYAESYLAKWTNVLYRHGFTIPHIDLNYHFDLAGFDDDYAAGIWRNARKNLHIALGNNLSFKACDSLPDKETAYRIIHRNREARGFPLRMTWEQVRATIELIPADFFVVKDEHDTPIAAAIVFTVAKGVAQVIYWGDLPDYSQLKTMNFLSYRVFAHYKERAYRLVDIGPSTEDGLPNHGLCEFKESIGCAITPKMTWLKTI